VKAALIAAAVNIAFKVLLMGPLAQVGLALATSIGAWINLGLVLWFAHRAGYLHIDQRLRDSAMRLALAGLALSAVLWFGYGPVAGRLAGAGSLHDVAVLVVLGAIGAAVYGGMIWLFFGRAWLAAFRAKRRG
jgi:putative peptidoglycan lipid II flippase